MILIDVVKKGVKGKGVRVVTSEDSMHTDINSTNFVSMQLDLALGVRELCVRARVCSQRTRQVKKCLVGIGMFMNAFTTFSPITNSVHKRLITS